MLHPKLAYDTAWDRGSRRLDFFLSNNEYALTAKQEYGSVEIKVNCAERQRKELPKGLPIIDSASQMRD